MWEGDEETLLVFHERPRRWIRRVLPLIKCKLRIIDERVVGVIVLLIFLLNECGSCKKTLEENEGATDPPLVSPLAAVLVVVLAVALAVALTVTLAVALAVSLAVALADALAVALAVALVALVHANRWCGRTEARRAGDLSDIDLVVVWPA